ncbi:hypothetical protein ACPA54_35240 [Uniformispora flossi]
MRRTRRFADVTAVWPRLPGGADVFERAADLTHENTCGLNYFLGHPGF